MRFLKFVALSTIRTKESMKDAKAAGFIREPTPLDYLHRYWRKVSEPDRLCFLADMLSNLESDEVTIEMSAPNRAGIITPAVEGRKINEDILMLVMPVMLNQYA